VSGVDSPGEAARSQVPAKRALALLATLYVAQGVPFGFFAQALPAVLRQRGMDLKSIAATSLLSLPWALKFAWAPLVDRYGSERWGRRKTFIVPLQIVSVLLLVGLSQIDPSRATTALVVGMFLTNLVFATQDIATDALAVDLLSEESRGLGNGIQVAGYRLGMILGGFGLLWTYAKVGLESTYAAMALLLLALSLPVMVFREPRGVALPAASETPGLFAWWEFLRLPGTAAFLLVLCTFKGGESMASMMVKPLLVDQGFSLEDIAILSGFWGFSSSALGALAGGALASRLGRRVTIVLAGLAQSAGIALFALLSRDVVSFEGAIAIVVAEHLTSGMATASLFTAMMDRCRPSRAASDYTVQASVVVVAQGIFSASSGHFAPPLLSYPVFFLCCAAISAVGALLAAVGLRAAPGRAAAG
jgi:PAT family beta-lactamase induction signal transducer AmpG